MNASDALQYLAAIAADFARTLPGSAQMPFTIAVNEALQTLAPLTNAPDQADQADPAAMVNGDGRATRQMEGKKRERAA